MIPKRCSDHSYHLQIDGSTGIEISGINLLSKSIHLAQYMQKSLGMNVGDVISICSENRIEFAVTNLAILLIGATIAPFNHSYTGGMFFIYV